MSMTPFTRQLVDDLSAFATELVSKGLHTGQRVACGTGTVSHTMAVLKAIDFLSMLVPSLISELQFRHSTRKASLYYAPFPKRAILSQRPYDYQRREDGTILPTRWLNVVPTPEEDTQPLRWLLYLIHLQQVVLERMRGRLHKFIEDSLMTQQGDSEYAAQDRQTLLAMRGYLDEAQAKLNNAWQKILRTGRGIQLSPTAQLPFPYPATESWVKLRRYAEQLTQPDGYLSDFLWFVFHGNTEIADTPYLYQRWCGLNLLKSFNRLGWHWLEDPVGALFLGGVIRLRKYQVTISIWVEPRLSRRIPHPSGFICQETLETHPDFLIVTPGSHRPDEDAFILDPTTSADPEIRHGKRKYLITVERADRASVAGVPVVKNPLRAWAAAPLHWHECELDDPEGRSGTIPMHPLDWKPEPLLAWVNDISRHALAWGNFLKP